MIKTITILTILLFLAVPVDLPAFSGHRTARQSLGSTPPAHPDSRAMRVRLRMPIRFPMDRGETGKPAHPIYPGHRPGRGRPGCWYPVTATVVREVQPVIIVNNLPAAEPAPPPEPEKEWVPPVLGTRTEPGYWDYGIRQVWMGDHWRFEQDFEKKTWVPPSRVKFVRQQGYWKTVE